MPGRVVEHDRVLRRDGIERVTIREARAGPRVLIPTGPAHPTARRRRRDALGDATRRFLDARHALEVDRLHREARVQQMRMRIGEAWQHEPPVRVKTRG